MTPAAPLIREARFEEFDPQTLYSLLQLRSEIFVVEQDCVYLDLDGRDTEPQTRHFWIDDGGRVLSALRLLRDEHYERIGRVVTAAAARGQGLSSRLLAHTLEASSGPWILSGQLHLAPWYERFGFGARGDDYLEDGIPHICMVRPAINR
ncbi:MAG: GNAT family N-acetyltransferase [Pseudomonadota bacterium]